MASRELGLDQNPIIRALEGRFVVNPALRAFTYTDEPDDPDYTLAKKITQAGIRVFPLPARIITSDNNTLLQSGVYTLYGINEEATSLSREMYFSDHMEAIREEAKHNTGGLNQAVEVFVRSMLPSVNRDPLSQ